jgi:hypothetical protein
MNDAAAVIGPPPGKAAKLAAVETLLADPESLGDDVLEACLYLLRERLSDGTDSTETPETSPKGPEPCP